MIEKISEHVYRKLQQPDTDRPHLYLIQTQQGSIAIDAGNSAAHVKEFYREIEEAGL
ncbi:MAG: MBL fold metallo-hydrolase, partial [Erysipelotrichaceae bacterium]|nr:MBL fold metallo-hydrolase [Erysipelotrichaceae bacterium]